MVTRILVEESVAEGVPLAAAATSIKKESIKKEEDTTDDDGEEDKLSTTTATAVVTPPKDDSNDRKRKADTLDVLVEGEPVTAEIVQYTDNDIDPLIFQKDI